MMMKKVTMYRKGEPAHFGAYFFEDCGNGWTKAGVFQKNVNYLKLVSGATTDKPSIFDNKSWENRELGADEQFTEVAESNIEVTKTSVETKSKPKRKRRTRAEIKADKLAEAMKVSNEPMVDGE